MKKIVFVAEIALNAKVTSCGKPYGLLSNRYQLWVTVGVRSILDSRTRLSPSSLPVARSFVRSFVVRRITTGHCCCDRQSDHTKGPVSQLLCQTVSQASRRAGGHARRWVAGKSAATSQLNPDSVLNWTRTTRIPVTDSRGEHSR